MVGVDAGKDDATESNPGRLSQVALSILGHIRHLSYTEGSSKAQVEETRKRIEAYTPKK